MIKLDHKKIRKTDKIREMIMAKLHTQSSQQRRRKSRAIKRRLFQDRSFQAAGTVMFYVSKEYEVDTDEMIAQALKSGKRIVVPVTKTQKKRLIPSEIQDPKRQLHKGPFGVYQPKQEYLRAVPIKKIDLVVVPGVAFDKRGNRIGHGLGYFDRFLRGLPSKTPTIGLAFKCQLVDRIEALPWDVPVTKVIAA